MRLGDGRQIGLWNRRRDDLLERTPVDIYERDGAPLPWRGNQLDVDALERFDEQATSVVRDPYYQQAIEYAHQVEDKAEMWLDHARVREAVANYLQNDVWPCSRDPEYLTLAAKLKDARPLAFYGADPLADEDRPAIQWTNRAGLVKLCPDDAREDQQRAVNLYTDRLVALGEDGFLIRYAVFTMPNAAQWHLSACIDAAFRRFRNEIIYGRTDGKIARRIGDPMRRFPNLVGAWSCLETPLSARHTYDRANSWNVHLNCLMVFRPDENHPKGWPSYQDIHKQWGARIHWTDVQAGSADATRAAIRELVKYPLKAVSLKTLEKSQHSSSKAPPLIEWPAEYFVEWWRAHKGLRRARSWGALYANGWPREPARDADQVDWFGRVRLTVAACDVSLPLPDYMAARDRSRDLSEWRAAWKADTDAMRRRIDANPSVMAWREEAQRQRAAAARKRDAYWGRSPAASETEGAESSDLYLIQGNKFSRPAARAGPDPPEMSTSAWLEGYDGAESKN